MPGVDNATKNVPNKEELRVFLKDHTNREAADHFGLSLRTLVRWLNRFGFDYYTLKHGHLPTTLTPFQSEAMAGCLLGDATVHHAGWMKFKQSVSKIGYVEHLHGVFSPFARNVDTSDAVKPVRVDGKVIHGLSSETVTAAHFQTITSPIFKALRRHWYPDGKKIIPDGLKLTPVACSYWFMDDGHNDQKGKEATFATHSFTISEAERLKSEMSDLAITTTVQVRHGKPILAISRRSYFDFMEMIAPVVSQIPCMTYKCDTCNAPLTKEGHGAGKLDMQRAKEIRRLYLGGGYVQKDLAAMFGVSVSTIRSVLSHQSYPSVGPSITGTSPVSVGYHWEAEKRRAG